MIIDTPTANGFEHQFQKWIRLKNEKKPVDAKENRLEIGQDPVITVSNEPGCSISAVTPVLAQGLGLDTFDAEIVDLIANNAHLSRRMVETLDEKTRSDLDEWLAEEVFDDEFTSKKYLKGLRTVIFTIAAHGNAIIIGRGAAFLIEPEERLALRFVAPLEDRVKSVMQEQHMAKPDAQEFIANHTRQRRSFVKKHFHADVEDAANYTMAINTAFVNPKAILEIVKIVLSKKEPL